jgi:DNA polymerase III delta prime subunit
MNADEKCILLAERIVKILKEGIHIDSDVMHFIDSTFSSLCLNELKKIIADNSDCERDSLIELIFFPDEEIQAKLEDLLESHNYCREDEKKVLDYLSSGQIESTIHFPDNKGALSVKMPYETAGRFLARLNIHRNIDEKISAAIDTGVSEKLKISVRVKLRNTVKEIAENKIFFLCDFFEKMEDESGDFLECLDFILSFLDEAENTSDLFSALIDKKRFYFKNLQRAEKFRQQLEKGNMETMILQGVKAPYINIEDEKRKMELIDKISLSVFGRTEYFENALQCIQFRGGGVTT